MESFPPSVTEKKPDARVAPPLRQPAGKEQPHEGGARECHRQPHRCDSEQGKPVGAGQAAILTVHHEVGAGAHQCQRATENRGVAQRNHQLGRRDIDAPRPAVHGRNHGGNDGRVVEKGAEQRHRRKQAQHGAARGGGPAQQALHNQLCTA